MKTTADPERSRFVLQTPDFYSGRARHRPWGGDECQKRGRERDRKQPGLPPLPCTPRSSTLHARRVAGHSTEMPDPLPEYLVVLQVEPEDAHLLVPFNPGASRANHNTT